MSSKSTEATEPELADERRPSRAGYYFSQLLKTLLYVCLVIIVFLLAVAWTIFISFTVAPIICWKRGYRKLLEYYSAPFELQGELFHSYRDALRVGTSEWDFEKGKPQPIALQPRGFKTVHENVNAKPKSNSLLELPPEIRLQIYRDAILGDSTHVRIAVHRRVRPGENRSSCIIHGHLSKRELGESPPIDCKCFDLHQDGPRTPHRYRGRPLPCDVDAGGQSSRGILAISKTCRQMYMETIDLLYSLPTFHFDYPTNPPFFLQSILPQRLALIRHIQICFTQSLMKNPCANAPRPNRRFRHSHALQQCPRCNIDRWLELIRKTMTNLERIDALVFIDVEMPPMTVEEPWVTSLLNLQHGPNGLRDLRIHTNAIAVDYMPPGSLHTALPHPSTAESDQLDRLLQDKVKEGAEAISRGKTADEAIQDKKSPDGS